MTTTVQREAEVMFQSLVHSQADVDLAERRDRLVNTSPHENEYEESLRFALLKLLEKEINRRARASARYTGFDRQQRPRG